MPAVELVGEDVRLVGAAGGLIDVVPIGAPGSPSDVEEGADDHRAEHMVENAELQQVAGISI